MASTQPQDPTAKVVVGLKAIALGLFAQLLIAGLEIAIEMSPFPFPASILAMFVLFVSIVVLGYVWEGFEEFYVTHLRQPANVVNRHMSVGFSVPIVMLARSPVASGDTVARIIACFIIAGVVSTAILYVLAVCSQRLFDICIQYSATYRRRGQTNDEEAAHPSRSGRSSRRLLALVCAKCPASTTDVSSVATLQDPGQQSDRDEAKERGREEQPRASRDEAERSLARRAFGCFLDKPLLIIFWFFTLVICFPLRYAAGLEEPLGISLLLTLWTTMLFLQTSIKANTLCLLCLSKPKFRTALSVACNPVLWTALGLIAYASAEAHRSGRPVESILLTLERNTTLADLLMHRTRSGSEAYIDFRLSSKSVNITGSPTRYHSTSATPQVAAGDIANAILSAGLVCWGLKLWEYRRRLLSRAGFTILLVSCSTALANVVLGPLLAKEILGPHSQPGYDLAFVARSVTLALGAPAVAKLGGDVGLNAAMVVVNGIMYQMLLGLGAGEWLRRYMDILRLSIGEWWDHITSRTGDQMPSTVEKSGVECDRRASLIGLERHSVLRGDSLPCICAQTNQIAVDRPSGPPATTANCTIASGVTIGIGAAAMGTAHLYEAGSDAAPFAALAMTVFGVATVGFTMIPQLAGWVVVRVQ